VIVKRPTSLLWALITATALAAAAALPASAAAEPPGPGGVSDSLLLAVVASAGDDVFSTTDLTSLIDPTSTSTQHYGPYQSVSPDSGTCGNNWADDSFDRHFTVRQNGGNYTVIEQFKDGNFQTPSTTPPNTNQSPGACNTAPPPFGNGGVVSPGITGSLHGYFIITVPPGTTQLSNDPHCNAATMTNANCDTATFIDTHFSCSYGIDCTVPTFFFHYSAGDQSLTSHEWKNASADRGGNSGDIRSN